MPGMPKSPAAWAGFILAVFIAGAVISSIAKRFPQVGALSEGV